MTNQTVVVDAKHSNIEVTKKLSVAHAEVECLGLGVGATMGVLGVKPKYAGELKIVTNDDNLPVLAVSLAAGGSWFTSEGVTFAAWSGA